MLVEDVIDRAGEIRLAENPANAAAFGPPFVAPFFLWDPSFRLLFFQPSGAPGLKLRTNDLRMGCRRQHDVNVIAAAIDRMQEPSSVLACLSHLLMNAFALVCRERFEARSVSKGTAGTRVPSATSHPASPSLTLRATKSPWPRSPSLSLSLSSLNRDAPPACELQAPPTSRTAHSRSSARLNSSTSFRLTPSGWCSRSQSASASASGRRPA